MQHLAHQFPSLVLFQVDAVQVGDGEFLRRRSRGHSKYLESAGVLAKAIGKGAILRPFLLPFDSEEQKEETDYECKTRPEDFAFRKATNARPRRPVPSSKQRGGLWGHSRVAVYSIKRGITRLVSIIPATSPTPIAARTLGPNGNPISLACA